MASKERIKYAITSSGHVSIPKEQGESSSQLTDLRSLVIYRAFFDVLPRHAGTVLVLSQKQGWKKSVLYIPVVRRVAAEREAAPAAVVVL
jgi:hypothetical protein